ncbi:hypothetical protein PCASD_01330 [Puccinia coronata f. sp. avenae]|uniref:Uncharacterized protein n=1 Tax=Puccinia coronata f. sp. avenae TaxID=200324 RepID=A0A2N5VJ87_9BASI|nr:hypothetical protein PCASD_01330 [Puccinia coronata f. sp. avenae]
MSVQDALQLRPASTVGGVPTKLPSRQFDRPFHSGPGRENWVAFPKFPTGPPELNVLANERITWATLNHKQTSQRTGEKVALAYPLKQVSPESVLAYVFGFEKYFRSRFHHAFQHQPHQIQMATFPVAHSTLTCGFYQFYASDTKQ